MKNIKFAITTTALFIATVLLLGCSSVPSYIDEGEKELYDSLSDFQKDYATRTGLEAVKTIYLDTEKKVPMRFVLIPSSISPEHIKYYGKDTFISGKYFWGEDDTTKAPDVKDVKIERPFYVGSTLVTLGQWKAVMGDEPNIVSFEEIFREDLVSETETWEDQYKKDLDFVKGLLRKEPLLIDMHKAFVFFENLDRKDRGDSFRKEVIVDQFPVFKKMSPEKVKQLYDFYSDVFFSGRYSDLEAVFRYEKASCNNKSDINLLCEDYYSFKDTFLADAKRLVFLRSDAGMQVPVDSVSYDEIQDNPQSFMETLSFRIDHKASLPSVEEWEYAFAAGTETRYPWGDRLEDGYEYSWGTVDPETGSWPDPRNKDKRVFKVDKLYELYDEYPRSVALLKCNPWGLYDMVGVLDEFCAKKNVIIQDYNSGEFEYRKLEKNEACCKSGGSRGINGTIPDKSEPRSDTSFRVKLSISDKELEEAKKKVEKK